MITKKVLLSTKIFLGEIVSNCYKPNSISVQVNLRRNSEYLKDYMCA